MDVDLHADPACPWCITALSWLDTVAGQIPLTVHVQPFSLLLRDGAGSGPPQFAAARQATHAALRVLDRTDDPQARRRILSAVHAAGAADLAAGRALLPDVARVLLEAGADPALVAARDDPGPDAAIAAGMARTAALLGVPLTGVRIPVLVLRAPVAPPVAVQGPLLATPPTAEEALAIWAAVRGAPAEIS